MNAVDILRKRVLPWTLVLYSLSLLTSMAGMEIFGWLSAALVLGLWAYDWSRTGRRERFIWHSADWALLALFIVVVLGAFITAPEPPVGWGAVTIIGSARFVFLYFLLRQGLLWCWNDAGFRKLVHAMIVVSAIIGLYAVIQHFTGIDILRDDDRAVTRWGQRANGDWYYRAAGLFNHPLRYSYAVGMGLCFPLAFFISHRNALSSRARAVMAVSTLLMAGGLIASLTRGAWIAVAGAVFVMSFYRGWKIAVGLLVAGVIVLGGIAAVAPELVERAKSIADLNHESNSSRINLWKANIEMFKDQPLLGVGYGQNEALIGPYFDRMGMPEDAFQGHAHNNYLQFLSGTGLLGFLSWFFFIGFYVWLSHRLYRQLPDNKGWLKAFVLATLGMQIVMHLGGLTEANFKSAQLTHFFMFVLAALSVLAVRANSLRYTSNTP